MDKLRIMSLETGSEDETEADSICVSHVLDQTITPDPKCIPSDYVDSGPKAQPSAQRGYVVKITPKPDQKTKILISHTHQTDTEAGDYFGATLYTYKRTSGKKYKYQHLLKDIKDGYPAQLMRICEGDELVLLDQSFTPDLDHTEVLNRFHHDVKVDGKTRFCLVLRRSETKGKERFWYWYETSAILAPDPKGHRSPDVLQPQCAAVDGKRTVQQKVYAIPSNTSLYMFIDESGIRAVPIEKDDHSVYVNKIIQFSLTPEGYTSQKALCGKDNKSYVHIDEQRNVCIREEPTWFDKGKHVGDDDSFGTNGYYLVFDRISQKFAMVATCDNQKTVETFRGYRLNKGLDSTDDACALRTTS